MLGDEHDVAFTVAKMMDTDLLNTVQDKLSDALAKGETLADFKKALIPTLQKAGWWGKKDVIDPLTGAVVKAQLGSASRLETIFRSNIQSAYSVGHWDKIALNARAAPYLMYDAVDDFRTRPEHAARDGEVYPVHSDFWQTHFPPNGWNCRCGVVQLDKDDLADMGLTPIAKPNIPTHKWKNPRTGTVLDVPNDVDPGWDHNPGKARKAHIAQLADDKAESLLKKEQRKATKAALAKQKLAQEAYEKELANNKAIAALAKKQDEATDTIAKALQENTPYLASEIKKIQKATPDMDPIALVAQARAKALKSEQNSMVQTWKQSKKKGKTPSAKAQAYIDSLPDDVQASLNKELDDFLGVSKATDELLEIGSQAGTLEKQAYDDLLAAGVPANIKGQPVKIVAQIKKDAAALAVKAEKAAVDSLIEIHAGQATVQKGLKKKIFDKWAKDGSKKGLPAQELLAAIEKEAGKQQLKAEKSAVLSGYKKKVLANKIPTPKQQQVFAALDDVEKNKLLASIDKKKAELAPAPTNGAAKINTAPEPAPPQGFDYAKLQDLDAKVEKLAATEWEYGEIVSDRIKGSPHDAGVKKFWNKLPIAEQDLIEDYLDAVTEAKAANKTAGIPDLVVPTNPQGALKLQMQLAKNKADAVELWDDLADSIEGDKDYKLLVVKREKLVKTQWGEDWNNSSSKFDVEDVLAAKKPDDLDYKGKIKPIMLDETMTIMDGNHRHATATAIGADEVLVVMPIGKGTGKIVNLDDAIKALAGKPQKATPKPGAAKTITIPKPYSDLSDNDKYASLYHSMGLDEDHPWKTPTEYKNASKTQKEFWLEELVDGADDAFGETPEGITKGFINQAAKDGESWAVKKIPAPTPPKAAAIPAKAPVAPTAAPDTGINTDSLTQIGPQGGSNPGGLFQDTDTGIKWYIKEPKSIDAGRNEVLAGKFYQAAGIEVPEMKIIRHDGKNKIASKIIDDLQADQALLTGDADIPGVADGYMMDAWLGNWDVVGMGYDNLLVKAGRAIRVDTGGALRYRAQGGLKHADDFGNIVKEIDSLRNGSYSQTTSVFGKLTKEQQIASARKVLAFTDEQIDDLIAAHGPKKAADRKALAATMKARRDHIAKAYPEAKLPAKKAPAPASGRVTRIDEENVKNSRINGYALDTDKDSIEDQSVLVWNKTDGDGNKVTSGYLKLRGPAMERLQEELGSAAATVAADYNDLHQTVISAIVSIRHRIKMGESLLSGSGYDKAASALARYAQVEKAMAAEVTKGLRSKAQLADFKRRYKGIITDIKASVAAEKPIWNQTGPDFKAFKIADAKSPPTEPGKRGWQNKQSLTYGLAKRDQRSHHRESGEYTSLDTQVFETEIDGAKVRFFPDLPNVKAALRGRVEIDVPGADNAAMARIFETIESLGVDATKATAIDQEALYLSQLAYIHKLDKQVGWNKAVAAGDIPKMKALISKKAGVDIDNAHYNPFGEHQAFEHGRRTRYRPDMLGHPEWAEFEREHRIIHNFTSNGGSVLENIKAIVGGGGQMAPTADKLRRGLEVGGMSPGDDLRTGGAQYFFTRLWSKEQAKQAKVVWKARVAARVDSISYTGDKYGRTFDNVPNAPVGADFVKDYVQTTRKRSISDLRGLAGGSNETLVKDSLSLFDDLDYINASNQTERKQVIAWLKKEGYDKWPDGRPLNEVIRVGGNI